MVPMDDPAPQARAAADDRRFLQIAIAVPSLLWIAFLVLIGVWIA